MSNSESKPSEDRPWLKGLIFPILIALIAGGTSPWWIKLFPGGSNASTNPPGTVTNTDRSVIIDGSGNQVDNSDHSINLVGEGNQINIQKESEARSRGEFDIPTISGMSYHEARAKLVDEGWVPQTQRHFYGNQPDMQFGNAPTFWDLGYWEIVTCSGSAEAFCRFEFADPSGRLAIETAGIEDKSAGMEAQVNRVFFVDEEL
ncbi:MAG: hypothetical protein ACTS2F_29965 [Thainema sp.]